MDAATADELLPLGREALAGADWECASALFERAAGCGESAEVLDGLGETLQFGGELPAARGITVARAIDPPAWHGMPAAKIAWATYLAIIGGGDLRPSVRWSAGASCAPTCDRR